MGDERKAVDRVTANLTYVFDDDEHELVLPPVRAAVDLLMRYIAWVIANEGVDFITDGGYHGGPRTNFFDDDDWGYLHELAKQAQKYADKP